MFIHHNMSFPTTAAADTSFGSSPLDNVDVALLSEIISFVGINQYRFVSTVNRTFQRTYFNLFAKNRWTYLNASTVEHAKICWEEIDQNADRTQAGLCVSAAKNGCILALQYLRDVKCLWCSQTCSIAARNGHLNVLQWCCERDCPWDRWTCDNAAHSGHLEILKWCQENGCPWSAQVMCQNAARSGNVDVLKFCREHGCPWNESTCAAAAEYDHIHIIKWCRANDCPWNASARTCSSAARNGHLQVLQWARENGCPWDAETYVFAKQFGYPHISLWAQEDLSLNIRISYL